MASNATIFRARLDVADMDRGYYAEHPLTLARHASETDERMMVRLLAFALHASERLEFGKGIGTADEPDLIARDLTGRAELWIEVGQPDERRIRRACSQSARVVIYAYGGRGVDLWWGKLAPEVEGRETLEVIALDAECTQAMAALAAPGMEVQLLVQEGEVWLSSGADRIAVTRRWLHGAPPAVR